jgi:hypothetical protein
MNLQQYANHRAARGLSGTSHVAVKKAAEAGRLGDAAKKTANGWEIDPEKADALWAGNTHPGKGKPLGGNTGGRPRTQPVKQPPPAAKSVTRERTAREQIQEAESAEAQAVLAQYQKARGQRENIRAAREALAYQAELGKFLPREEIKTAIAGLLTNAKNRLRAMGNKLAPELEYQDAITCQALVDAEVDEALLELSKWEP